MIITGLILSLILLSACGAKGKTDKALQPPVKGLRWGMTLEEVKEAMKLKDSEIIEVDDSAVTGIQGDSHIEVKREGAKIYGETADISMVFQETTGGLYFIAAEFATDDAAKIDALLEKNIGKDYKVDVNYYSVKTISALPEEVLGRFETLIKTEATDTPLIPDTDAYWKEYAAKPLVQISQNRFRAPNVAIRWDATNAAWADYLESEDNFNAEMERIKK